MKRAAAVAVIALSGCSWTFTRGPERGKPCATSSLPAAIDTYEAVGSTAIALASLSYVNEGHSDGDVIGLVGVISAGLAVLYAASAKHGFDRVAECRDHRP